jgi:hypothetical protein
MAASSCLVPTGKECSTCYRKFLRGTGQEEPLFESSSSNKYPMDWSSDGRFILYAQIEEKTGYDVWALPLFGERKPFPVLITLFDERYPQFSPDGRWVAYQSNGRARTISICSPFLDLGDLGQWRRAGAQAPRRSRIVLHGPGPPAMAVAVTPVSSRLMDTVPDACRGARGCRPANSGHHQLGRRSKVTRFRHESQIHAAPHRPPINAPLNDSLCRFTIQVRQPGATPDRRVADRERRMS